MPQGTALYPQTEMSDKLKVIKKDNGHYRGNQQDEFKELKLCKVFNLISVMLKMEKDNIPEKNK